LDLQPQPEEQPLSRRQSGTATRTSWKAARFDDEKETTVPHTHASDHSRYTSQNRPLRLEANNNATDFMPLGLQGWLRFGALGHYDASLFRGR